MAKKRKSGGRRKSGTTGRVQCSQCGRFIPRDKAKIITKRVPVVDFKIEKELRDQGTILPKRVVSKIYCVSCAVHR
ncbi:MAG: 30S ribosomal protein S26e, partial [Promethearchaeota archaeon]